MLAARRIPIFLVRDDGAETGPAAWWQRREMVVAMLHADCATCARFRERLDARAAALRAREAGEVRLAIDGAGERGGPAERVRSALGLEPGAAFAIVADRYGEVFAAEPVHGDDADRVLGRIEGWLDHIQLQCPE